MNSSVLGMHARSLLHEGPERPCVSISTSDAQKRNSVLGHGRSSSECMSRGMDVRPRIPPTVPLKPEAFPKTVLFFEVCLIID